MLVQKMKHRVYKFMFLSEAILCRDSAGYYIYLRQEKNALSKNKCDYLLD